jgi:hypothetical protein
VLYSGDLYFRHRVPRPDGKVRHCFWLGRVDRLEGGHWALRFCKPSEPMKRDLIEHRANWYLPPATPAEEAVKLINEHADYTYRMP